MLYELRIYHCTPGKLPALLTRFETATVKLFEKHGIQQVGFWTVAVGESEFGPVLHPEMGFDGGSRQEVRGLSEGSGLDRGACEE